MKVDQIKQRLPYQIVPSLLSANFAQLGQEAMSVLAAGGDRLHLDVMDNHYVPQLTVGPLVCRALRQAGIIAPIDVHLMASPLDQLIDEFAAAGASSISFHPEATLHIDASLMRIRRHHCQAGLVFNPTTVFDYGQYVLDKLDMITVMSVNPGFSGQTFIPAMLDKIKACRAWLEAHQAWAVHLAVDGGVNLTNIAQIACAGADMFIAGSAIFAQADYQVAIKAMRQALAVTN